MEIFKFFYDDEQGIELVAWPDGPQIIRTVVGSMNEYEE